MRFSQIKKAAILLMVGIISFCAADSFASATWLSTITGADAPAGIAVDSKGNIYVTERYGKNRLLILDRRGVVITSKSGMADPTSVAVDRNFRVYVGSGTKGTHSVSVFNPDFSLACKLGKGDGEFTYPAAIAVSASGQVFVTDRDANVVKVYSADGKSVTSFGGYGRADGQFNTPMGLAIDNANSEIYVTDLSLIPDASNGNALMGGARVQVFDLNGTFKRSFGSFGSATGQMGRPVAIAYDGAGSVYVVDTFWVPAAIHAFTATGSWIETIADTSHMLKNPVGVAIGKDGRLFATSMNGSAIQVYGLDGYITMDASPSSLAFTVEEGGANPATQNITIANNGSGALNWTAAATTTDGGAWLAPTASGAVNANSNGSLSVAVASNGLRAGAYSGSIVIKGFRGSEQVAEENISVQLTVTAPPMILNVSPAMLSFKAQQNGPAPAAQTIAVKNAGGGNMPWVAATGTPWLKLDPSPTFVRVSPNTGGLAAGTYSAQVVIDAPGAQGTPAAVSISVQVVLAGTIKVNSNVDGSSFDITGPVGLSGAGKTWSRADVAPGDYTITFKRLPGYTKPVSQKFTVKTGQDTVVTGDYRKKKAATHVAAAGAGQVVIMPLESGKSPRTFIPFAEASNITVATGDVDGSGFDSVVVTDGKKNLKIFSERGDLLASYILADDELFADVAVSDVDNDGKSEVVIGLEGHRHQRLVKTLSYAANAVTEKATLFTEEKTGSFSLALGDVNDDGLPEVVIADSNGVRAFQVQQSALSQVWVRNMEYASTPRVAVGDLNGDGLIEIAVSYEQMTELRGKDSKGKGNRGKDSKAKDDSSLITILKGTGEDYNLTVEPFKNMGYKKVSSISMGDIDSDNAEELVAGSGQGESKEPIARIFESDGSYAGTTMKPISGTGAVNVAFGAFQE